MKKIEDWLELDKARNLAKSVATVWVKWELLNVQNGFACLGMRS